MRDLEAFSVLNRTLVTEMRHPHASVRLQALALAVDDVDDELAEEMLRLLRQDPSEEVRAQVPVALGPTLEQCADELDEDGYLTVPGYPTEAPLSQLAYDRLVEALRRLYLDAATPAPVRRKVLEGAVRSPQPWQARAAAAAFRSGDESWRITAVFCMGHLEGFDDEIAEAFDTGSPAVRFEAIRAAGRRGLRELARSVRDLAEDPGADVDERLAAVEALADMELPGTFEILEELRADPVNAVAEAAAEALEELSLWPWLDDDLDDDWEEPWLVSDDRPDYRRRRRIFRPPTPTIHPT